MNTAARRRRAFTLVELLAVMVVLSALAAATAPIVASAGRTYADAAERREASQELAFALTRAARALGDARGEVSTAAPAAIELTTGERLEKLGSTLWLTLPAAAPAPLCAGVDAVTLQYFESDGVTDCSADPARAQRLHIQIERAGVRFATVIHLRRPKA